MRYDGDEWCVAVVTMAKRASDEVGGSNRTVLKSDVDVVRPCDEGNIEDVNTLVEDRRLMAEGRCEDITVSLMTVLLKIVNETSGRSSRLKFSGMTLFMTWTVYPASNNF